MCVISCQPKLSVGPLDKQLSFMNMIPVIGTSDQLYWLAESHEIFLLVSSSLP